MERLLLFACRFFPKLPGKHLFRDLFDKVRLGAFNFIKKGTLACFLAKLQKFYEHLFCRAILATAPVKPEVHLKSEYNYSTIILHLYFSLSFSHRILTL